jgi:hypothetical protein
VRREQTLEILERDPPSGLADREPMAAYASTEMLMPAYLAGTAPIATRPTRSLLVLGDLRGDMWMMDLTSTHETPGIDRRAK